MARKKSAAKKAKEAIATVEKTVQSASPIVDKPIDKPEIKEPKKGKHIFN